MANRGLSPDEVKKRLIRLRNLEYLHTEQKSRNQQLWEENQQLKQRVLLLEETVSSQQKLIEDLKLQVEELRTMVFGKKKKKQDIQDIDDDQNTPPQVKTQRSADSYQRPVPKDDKVTEVRHHSLDFCSCGAAMIEKQIAVFYEEDLPIPVKKIVRKHIVEKGCCSHCRRQQTAIPLPAGKVVLGANVQKYVCYLNVFCRLSFSQIQQLLTDTYQFDISQGEIAKILNREAMRLRPFYERLKEQIRGEPVVHLDETGWRLFIDQENSYAWVMSGAHSQESVFLAGESRGKGNANKLLGENFTGVVVSDDYGAYRKLDKHQLCWAHLIRKFRDLAQSGELEEKQRQSCQQQYAKLCLIYEGLKQGRSLDSYDKFARRLTSLSVVSLTDPKKLIRIKTTLRKNISKYLTCLTDPRIPLTNNQAERSLRHLVLKRKISFGSLNEKTADNLAVLLSVIMSLKQRYRAGFLNEYLRV